MYINHLPRQLHDGDLPPLQRACHVGVELVVRQHQHHVDGQRLLGGMLGGDMIIKGWLGGWAGLSESDRVHDDWVATFESGKTNQP